MTPLRLSRRFLHLALLMGALGFWALVNQSWVPAAGLVPLAGVMLFALLEVLLPLPNAGQRRVELGGRSLAGDEGGEASFASSGTSGSTRPAAPEAPPGPRGPRRAPRRRSA